MRNITRDIDKEIIETQKKLDELQKEKVRLDMMPEDQRLAEHLHEMKCHHNHIDGCAWDYETAKQHTDWSGHAHKEWLEKANNLLKIADYGAIVKIAKIL